MGRRSPFGIEGKISWPLSLETGKPTIGPDSALLIAYRVGGGFQSKKISDCRANVSLTSLLFLLMLSRVVLVETLKGRHEEAAAFCGRCSWQLLGNRLGNLLLKRAFFDSLKLAVRGLSSRAF
jgi:hypothetical protein